MASAREIKRQEGPRKHEIVRNLSRKLDLFGTNHSDETFFAGPSSGKGEAEAPLSVPSERSQPEDPDRPAVNLSALYLRR